MSQQRRFTQSSSHCTGSLRSGVGRRSQRILQRAKLSGHVINKSNLSPSRPSSSKLPAKLQESKGPKLQTVSEKSASRYRSSPSPLTLASVASKVTPPIERMDNSTRRGIDLVSAALNAGIASSSDEILFAMWVRDLGLKKAEQKAAKFGLQCERPLRMLRTMMNGRGKNYRVKSAKRKRAR
jgi:hypothetical protein